MTRVARRVVLALEIAGAVVLALVVAIVIFMWHINANDYRKEVVAAVEQATGLVVAIDGPLNFALMPLPTVVATGIRVANPPWVERSEMMRAERVELGLSPIDLVLRHNRLRRLALFGAEIYLETDRLGRANWWHVAETNAPETSGPDLGSASSGQSYRPPDISRLELHGAHIEAIDQRTGRTIRLGLSRAMIRLPAEGPFTVDALGDWFGTAFSGSLKAGRLADLVADQRQWPVSWRVQGAGTVVEARGTIDQPLSQRGLDLAVTVSGQRLSSLTPLLGLWLPELGPYRGTAQLTGPLAGSPVRYRLARLSGQLGLSDFAGQLTVSAAGPRPRIDGSLSSRTLHRVDLIGGATASWSPPADGRLLSAWPLPLYLLHMVDGRVALKLERLVTTPIDLTEVEAALDLQDGRLSVSPLRAKVAGGHLALDLAADAARDQPSFHLAGRAERLAAEQILPAFGMTLSPTGPFSLELDLTGRGSTLRALLAHADGRARLTIGAGTLPVRHFDLIASDLIQAIMPWALRRGDRTELNCLVARFTVKNGQADAERLLIDTSRVTVTGLGTIDLKAERLDLKLDPRPKDPSLISLATRMRVTGSLSDYSAAPDAMGLAKGAAAGLALAVGEVNPLALFLPFVSIGTGIADPCRGELTGPGISHRPLFLAPLDATVNGVRQVLDRLGHALAQRTTAGVKNPEPRLEDR